MRSAGTVLIAGVGIILAGATSGACSRSKDIARDLPGDARLLGAFGGRVYWASGETLSWIDDGLDAPRSIDAVGVAWATRANFAADASGIYFSHHNKATHLARDPSGGGWMASPPQLDHPAGIAVDGENAYTLELDVDCRDKGAVVALSKANGDQVFRRDAPANGGQPVDFAMDGTFYYWIDGRGGERQSSRREQKVMALPRAGGNPIVVASRETSQEATPRTDLHAGTRGVYWRTSAGIRFAPKSATGFGAPSTLVAAHPPGETPRSIDALLVDGRDVFFADSYGIWWLPDGSSDARRIARDTGVRDLVSDDRFVYWTNTAANTLVRASRR